MIKAWRNDSLVLDISLCGVLFVISDQWVLRSSPSIQALLCSTGSDFYFVCAQIVAAILGFIIAAVAIIGAGSLTGLTRLRDERYYLYKRLITSFAESIFVSLFAVLFYVVAGVRAQIVHDTTSGIVAIWVLVLVLGRIARASRRLYIGLLS